MKVTIKRAGGWDPKNPRANPDPTLEPTLDVRGDQMQTYYCTCGMKVRGNGAKSSHRRVHFKAGDKHRYVHVGTGGLSEAEWRKLVETKP